MIEFGEEPHGVVRDVAARRVLAQHFDWRAVERHHLIGGEPAEGQPVRRVGFGHGQVGQFDFGKAAIFHRPEDVAPGGVERADGGVAVFQPDAKAIARGVGKAQHGIVAAVFIVGLPGDHRRVCAIALRHRARDPHRFGAVAHVAEAIVPPRTKPARAALRIDRHHIGHLVDQPFGRGGGGGAEDHAQPGRAQHIDRMVEPAPVEAAGFGLDPAPGKFADPHDAEASFGHPPRVLGPHGLRPMLRIIAHPQFHGLAGGGFRR